MSKKQTNKQTESFPQFGKIKIIVSFVCNQNFDPCPFMISRFFCLLAAAICYWRKAIGLRTGQSMRYSWISRYSWIRFYWNFLTKKLKRNGGDFVSALVIGGFPLFLDPVKRGLTVQNSCFIVSNSKYIYLSISYNIM